MHKDALANSEWGFVKQAPPQVSFLGQSFNLSCLTIYDEKCLITNQAANLLSSDPCFLHFQITDLNLESCTPPQNRLAQSAGFEPARAEPNRFLVCRLNHSATTA